MHHRWTISVIVALMAVGTLALSVATLGTSSSVYLPLNVHYSALLCARESVLTAQPLLNLGGQNFPTD